ncbi:ATP-binding cassette domain-containing protein [Geofilum sp. OHC36d9]|uniref:ATP-binding cassette domain-containing protein n=1 Tax=Geofilum sp. OHC36d9 TaxID=3458413 RepID=UPI004033D2B2
MMKVRALDSIVSLFALVAVYKPQKGFTLITNTLEVYLNSRFSRQTTDASIDLFHQKVTAYMEQLNERYSLFDELLGDEVLKHCKRITLNIQPDERLHMMVYLLEYLPYISDHLIGDLSGDTYEMIKGIAGGLNISEADFNDAICFILDDFELVSAKNQLFIICDNPNLKIPGVAVKVVEDLKGQIVFLRLTALNVVLFRIVGDSIFDLNDRRLYKRRTYYLKPGGVIHSDSGHHFFFNDIYKALTVTDVDQHLELNVGNLEYFFSNGQQGIHRMSFKCESGEMMAIMGGSGSGKTTLMNLLIGAYKPYSGHVRINNVEVFANPELVKGYIGFVPQDDALNEELTAFENLFYVAGLSLGNLNNEARIQKVESVLSELGLSGIRNLKVGNPLDKVISGGQRKRLNIAIELIRDPGILFLDEPTSGLSSADSEMLIDVLREVADKGRIVVLNIHQPSSDIFKLFDKLLFIDQGGYPVYFGPAVRVVSYLKEALKLVDAHESECPLCGSLNPDDIFHLVERHRIKTKVPEAKERLFTPERWMNYFYENAPEEDDFFEQEFQPLKSQKLDIPHPVKQFRLYLSRLVASKLSDFSSLLLSIGLPAILAVLLSIFSYYEDPLLGYYCYHENENMPAYLFMSIIVAMFIGLMSGSAEINKDRRTLKRESFLNLSFGAYLFSKLTYLMLLNALQMFLFVFISCHLLKVESSGAVFWLIMWSLALTSSVMGLFISALFKSMSSVYVSIPFLLIPQILFSGAVIDFNKINKIFASDKYVPIVSELMPSRWGYEALMVADYTTTAFAGVFFDMDRQQYESGYFRNFLIPELDKAFYGDHWSTDFVISPDSASFELVMNGIKQLERYLKHDFSRYYEDELIKGSDFRQLISRARSMLSDIQNNSQEREDALILSMSDDEYIQLQQGYNKKILQVLTDESNVQKIKRKPHELIRKMSPLYFVADNNYGRSHLYASHKRFMNKIISTGIFNVVIIWLITFIELGLVAIVRPRY